MPAKVKGPKAKFCKRKTYVASGTNATGETRSFIIIAKSKDDAHAIIVEQGGTVDSIARSRA
ncbi:hypothetical protein [Aeromicrobium sp. 179-A 4D2 NHS]|uniref:hypothetical protein n=1 Tax=Aeromicrobium sp. 179-A 4D2 NHS TaxID=3142375 RepID=UPI0039A14AE1